MRRSGLLPLALLTAASFFVLSCDTASETVLSPDSGSAAKGGVPGPPDDSGGGDDGGAPADSLVEYYVIPSPDGLAPNVVHVVVDGSAAHLGAQLVHDYFFNGIWDDNYSPHYEYYNSAAFDPDAESVEVMANGYTHIDVEWSGEWWLPVSETDRDTLSHSDFLSTDVATAGGAADPFAFAPSVYDANRTRIAGWQPQGVILDGAVIGKAGITIPEGGLHAGSSVASYALHSGETAQVKVSLLSMTASDLSCTTATVREGQGRNKTTTTYTTISATAAAQLQMSDGQRHGYWAEFHLRPVGGAVSVTGSRTSINGGTSTDIGLDSPREFTVSTRFEGVYNTMAVELVMDYLVYAGVKSEADLSGTYDPAGNSDDGFVTAEGPSTTVDDGHWPEAVRQLGTVTCK